MTSPVVETVLMWASVSLYALSAVLFTVGIVFKRERAQRFAVVLAAVGLLPHAGAFVVRWVRVGHGPYLGFYEVVSTYSFIAVAMFVALLRKYRSLAAVGVVVMPVAFLLIAASMFTSKAELEIGATLASWWLVIHIMFAKLSYSSFIVSFALAVIFLVRERRSTGLLAKLPEQAVVDDLSFRFVGAGFILLSVMIAAGAIWANEAWGRYWAWDPIETWSLVTWLVYAVYLHARLTLGWQGRRASWVAVAALPIVLFSLMGVPVVYDSIHAAYISGF